MSNPENAATEASPSLDDLIDQMVDGAVLGDGEGDGEAAESVETPPESLMAQDVAEEPAESSPPEEPPADQDEPAPDEADQLSPEDKTFLASLPEKHRAAAERWRAEIKRGAQEKFDQAAGARREVEEVDRYLQPFADGMRSGGVTRAQLVGAMVQQMDAMKRDPVGAIESLAGVVRNSGAGPEQAAEVVRRVAAALNVKVGGTGAGQPSGQANDPREQRIAALEQELRGFKTERQQAQQREQQAAVAAQEAKIKAFADAKDAQGQSKYPHFAKVRATMGGLMQAAAASGEAMDLDTAYQRAVWARDDLRDDLIKARQAETAKAAAATRQSSVARARAAASPRTGPTTGAPLNTGGEKLSIDQMLDRGLAEMGRI